MKLIFAAFCLIAAPAASAHEVLDNLITLDARADGAISGKWEIPRVDVEDLLVDGKDLILQTVSDDLAVRAVDGPSCPVQFGAEGAATHKDQPYVVLPFAARCPGDDLRAIELKWTFLNEAEHERRALVSFASPGAVQSATMTSKDGTMRLTMVAANGWRHFLTYLHDGAFHIWTGADHILFLLTLMLPTVLVLRGRRWQPRPGFRASAIDTLTTVSAFTVAHSITLALVTFHVMSLPSRLVESVIAASVFLSAVNNLFGVVAEGRWKIAFVFGLVHGIGFAEVLVDLNLPTWTLINSLAGFNAGVELGQMAIVAAFLPLAFAARSTVSYRRIVFQGGSLAAAIVAALWFVDRAFDLGKMPF